MSSTLFVSDLHLDASRPRITRLFLDVLDTCGRDDDSALSHEVTDGLRACVASGTPVHLMHGNRDFLIGAQFAARTGCRLLDDPARIDLYGSPVLLMHGDILCTDDVEYRTFRAE